MAALQPSVGGLPAHDFSQKSFAAAVSAPSLTVPPLDTIPHPHATLPAEHGTPGTHKGLPSISFTDASMNALSTPFSWALIGKFTQGYNKKEPKLGRPSVEDLHKYFVALDFCGSFQIGLLDNRHLLIKFQLEADYLRLYSRLVWYIRGISMRIFKWSPYFRVDKESSVVPVWISLPRLPIQFFHKSALFPIARLLGQPLRLDEATLKLKRPSVARVQIELDVLLERPEQIWIQMGTKEGFWQLIEYENVPPYCRHCWHLGHEEALCHVQHPELKVFPKSQPTQPHQQRWVPVHVSTDPLLTRELLPTQQPNVVPISTDKQAVLLSTDTQTGPLVLGPALGSVAQSATAQAPQTHVYRPILVPKQTTVPQISGLTDSQKATVPVHTAAPVDSMVSSVPLLETVALHATVALHDTVAPTGPKHATVEPPSVAVVGAAGTIPLPTQDLDISVPAALPAQLDLPAPPKLSEPVPAVHAPLCVQAVDNARGLSAVPQLTDPPVTCSTTSLQATYKDVLLVSSLQEVVAQEIGFPPTTVAESAPERAIVVYQTDGHATASNFASTATVLPLATSSISPLQQAPNRWHPALDTDIGYNDSDYYPETLGSDDLGHEDYGDTDDHTYEDITDGSEGTHMKKKKDRQKLKGLASKTSATIDDFAAQSSLIDIRIRKRGRPPGSRNRTYFDVQRTMSTRTTKSTSD